MQIGASTLLAQQAARVTPKATQPTDAFSPLTFKQAEAPKVPVPAMEAAIPAKAEAVPAARQSAGAAYVRPGTNVDIKV